MPNFVRFAQWRLTVHRVAVGWLTKDNLIKALMEGRNSPTGLVFSHLRGSGGPGDATKIWERSPGQCRMLKLLRKLNTVFKFSCCSMAGQSLLEVCRISLGVPVKPMSSPQTMRQRLVGGAYIWVPLSTFNHPICPGSRCCLRVHFVESHQIFFEEPCRNVSNVA